MTPIQRIESRLAELSAEYSRLASGRAVLPPKAKTIAAKIAQLQQEREKERQKHRKYLTCNCRVLEGFLKQCEADEKSIAEAQTAAAEGDCYFGRRCSMAKGKRCVAKMPGPMLPAKETIREHRKM